MHKIVLPQVPSGNYIINDKYDSMNRRLLEIESKDGKWQILSDSNTRILNPKCIRITDEKINIINSTGLFIKEAILKEYNIYEVLIGDSEILYTLCCLPVYENNWIHLEMRHIQEVLIGRDKSNQISYENDLVSNTHARIFLNKDRWMIENYDKRYGTFLNDNLVYDKRRFLFNGDIIFIMGLKIILMENSIYINNPAGKMHYNMQDLILVKVREQEKINDDDKEEKYIELYSPKDYFYRSPRISNKINRKSIKIDPPPTKRGDDHMPLFLTVGSTACMGIMSLVSVVSTVSAIASGSSSLGESILSIISSIAMLVCMLLIPLMTTKWESQREKNMKKNVRKNTMNILMLRKKK